MEDKTIKERSPKEQVESFCNDLFIRKNSGSLTDYEYLKDQYFHNYESLPPYEHFCRLLAKYLGI